MRQTQTNQKHIAKYSSSNMQIKFRPFQIPRDSPPELIFKGLVSRDFLGPPMSFFMD